MARRPFLNFFPQAQEGAIVERRNPPAEANLLLRNFEESGRGWFWATNADGRLTYISDIVSNLFGLAQDALIGTPIVDLFVTADDRDVRDRLPFVLGRQIAFDKFVLKSVHSADPHWWEVSGRPCFSGANEFQGYRGYSIDVTEQLQSSHSASQLALFDTLTGLPNRLNMTQYLAASLSRVDHPGGACTVMLIDLDRFKQVNDSLGHPAGDALLKSVASRLFKIIGEKEKIFRLGGDEFQVILPATDDRGTLGSLAESIIESLSQPYMIEGSRCVIGASVGIAVAPYDGRTSEDLVRNADLALYEAKANGRGCFRFFSSSLLEVAEDRRVLENDLRDALSTGGLKVYYQPQVSTSTSCVTGVEALVRWHHPVRGPISPGQFVPIAEEANLIEPLGEWVLRRACEDAAQWPGDIRVAVNLSPIQFANEALPALVVSALANSGLPPSRLELELTEGVFLNESAATDAMFSNLKDLGIRLALDDFGTGYSSLGYLKTAPFDKIKIDQSFVRGATLPGSRNGAIIAAIVALAGALDMETTAEGIETLDQLDLIRELGVSHIQGYVYSRPIPNDDLSEQLNQGVWTLVPTGPPKQRSDRRAMFRRAGAIVGNYYHSIVVRNLSESGAFVEGLVDVPIGSVLVLDLGDGQFETAVVRRLQKRGHGIEFAQPLVGDGAGGLCTNRRISPYVLSRMGLSTSDHLGASRTWDASNSVTIEALAGSLGLAMPDSAFGRADFGSDGAHDRVKQAFAASNPLQNMMLLNSGRPGDQQLSNDDWERLKNAVESSHNTQLKYIIALVVLTGIRLHELMAAQWEDVDLLTRLWTVHKSGNVPARQIPITANVLDVIKQLPRWDECPTVIVNPRTRKPYNSFYGSWDAARKKAGLDHLSIHELRNSLRRTW
ncbi:MAG: EAL domain-containing protein [Sphingomonadales bacterium]|nr:EAL domain-containing protein [Sphingomonadales bacterium]